MLHDDTLIDEAQTKERGFKDTQMLAQEGDADAQFLVGTYHYFGKGGVSKDRKEAFEWFARAAENSGKATFFLALCHFSGATGVTRDVAENLWTKSIPLLTIESTEQGDSESMYCLIVAYLNGLGTEASEKLGFKWLHEAASHGHSKAQADLGEAYQSGYYGLEPDDKRAVEFFLLAAENGNARGQYRLGHCYHYGVEGVLAKDWIQALYWYRQVPRDNTWSGPLARAELNDLLHEVCAQQRRLGDCVQHSLKILTHTSSSSLMGSLGLWGPGLETLVAKRNQPAGFSPTFLVLTQLMPQIFRGRAYAQETVKPRLS